MDAIMYSMNGKHDLQKAVKSKNDRKIAFEKAQYSQSDMREAERIFYSKQYDLHQEMFPPEKSVEHLKNLLTTGMERMHKQKAQLEREIEIAEAPLKELVNKKFYKERREQSAKVEAMRIEYDKLKAVEDQMNERHKRLTKLENTVMRYFIGAAAASVPVGYIGIAKYSGNSETVNQKKKNVEVRKNEEVPNKMQHGGSFKKPKHFVERKSFKSGGNVSTTGYLPDSPDRFNDFNIIPGGDITMKRVPHPVMAYPSKGTPVLMQPGREYHFPEADYVTEIPVSG
jgi:hypothetical protein